MADVSPHLRIGNDALSHQAKAGVVPIAKPERRERRRAGLSRGSDLVRSTTLARTTAPARTPLSPATDEQKAKVDGSACVALDSGNGPCWGPIDPAHLVDRSLAPSAGDDIRAVIPLCRRHHNAYDAHDLDLSPLLEPRWRVEIAWAVEAVGLFVALRRITGKHWQPTEEDK